MKLVNTLYNLEFDLMENQILVLSIENEKYNKMVCAADA